MSFSEAHNLGTREYPATLCLRKKVKFLQTLLFLLAFFSFALAQETPPLVNYPLSAYKAHNQNWAIDQSTDRIVYSANSDGLLEFDGSSWKLYPLPNRQIVRAVLCDTIVTGGKTITKGTHSGKNRIDSRIYVGGYGEFGYWLKQADGGLIYHSLSKDLPFASLRTEEIWHILKTPDFVFFQSFSSIYQYDGKQVTEIKASGNFMFLRFVHGRILVQLIGQGLFELKDEKFIPIPGTGELAATTVSSILPFGNGRLLIATMKHGLFLLQHGILSPWKISLSEELKTNIINKAIVLGQDSSLAFGTIQKGVYIISRNGVLKYQFNKENGLQNNTVLALAEDKRKNLWVGLDQGIDLIKMSSPFVSFQTNDNPLGTIYAAALWKGNLYVGSNNGVFYKPWKSTLPFKPVPGLGGQTWNLKVVNGQLLCGHNDATFRIEQDGAKKISTVTGGWVFLPVKTGADTLLLQGSYTGLHVYKKNKQKLWAYAYPVKGVPPVPIRQIVQDKNGVFWLAHAYKGLFRTKLTSELDSAVLWKEYKSPDDVPSEFSVELTAWKDKCYIRSSSVFFEPAPDYQLRPSEAFGPVADEPFKIKAGIHNEWLKVFSNRVLLHQENTNPKSLDLSLVRNYETIIPVSDNYYFFCLNNGYALYDRTQRELIPANYVTPNIRKISNLRNPSETYPIEDQTTLPVDARSIRITYTVPVYGQNTQYKYRLSGLSDQWSDWTEQNFVEYTNLESGKYTFEIKSSLNDEPNVLTFRITPYWSETLSAKILFAILIASLLFAVFIYQERRLRRHRKKLIEEQEEKIRQERLSSERKIMEIQNEKLQSEIKSKSQQISNVAINVVRKNEILEEIRDELKQVKEELGQQLPNIHYQKLLNSIERNVAGKEDWQLFEENFNEVHEEFFKRLRVISPTISPSELRLAACLRMNLSTKEMAPALGISIRGVEIKRYRLRKKLNLGLDANLVQYMMDI